MTVHSAWVPLGRSNLGATTTRQTLEGQQLTWHQKTMVSPLTNFPKHSKAWELHPQGLSHTQNHEKQQWKDFNSPSSDSLNHSQARETTTGGCAQHNPTKLQKMSKLTQKIQLPHKVKGYYGWPTNECVDALIKQTKSSCHSWPTLNLI